MNILLIISIFQNTKKINEFMNINNIKRKKLKARLMDINKKTQLNNKQLEQLKDHVMLNSMNEYNEDMFNSFIFN